jgi:magnesium transporter
MIASICGINFKHMPELDWEYGCFGVIGTILLVCAGLWRFRRVG